MSIQPTSFAARASLEPHLELLEKIVMTFLEDDPKTCDAIEELSGLSHQSASARLTALSKRGIIYDTGLRAPTRSGRKAIKWAISQRQTELFA